jgi:hypothetical protein
MRIVTKGGGVLDDADLAALADKAEAGGFDAKGWGVRRAGRPALSDTTRGRSPQAATRIPAEALARAKARARAEGKTLSQVQRELLVMYGDGLAVLPQSTSTKAQKRK